MTHCNNTPHSPTQPSPKIRPGCEYKILNGFDAFHLSRGFAVWASSDWHHSLLTFIWNLEFLPITLHFLYNNCRLYIHYTLHLWQVRSDMRGRTGGDTGAGWHSWVLTLTLLTSWHESQEEVSASEDCLWAGVGHGEAGGQRQAEAEGDQTDAQPAAQFIGPQKQS